MTDAAPRLRVERLVIVESRSPLSIIRDVRLRGAQHRLGRRAGCVRRRKLSGARRPRRRKDHVLLMIRAVLGDDGAAVKTMRNHLADHYGSGGIAAEVVAGTERFAVLRSFGSQSFALKDATVEQLFEGRRLRRSTSRRMWRGSASSRASPAHGNARLPVTGQAVEWGHVLCWLARDQAPAAAVLQWRNDDGTGLRRKVRTRPRSRDWCLVCSATRRRKPRPRSRASATSYRALATGFRARSNEERTRAPSSKRSSALGEGEPVRTWSPMTSSRRH